LASFQQIWALEKLEVYQQAGGFAGEVAYARSWLRVAFDRVSGHRP
jgi:hypothetical protein